MSGGVWRLLDLALGDGPWNMAVDEAILASVAAGRAPTTLRLYGWSQPCISIGCAQAVSDLDLEACEREGLPLVRRASGGTAVLHEASLAYSLTLPADHPLAAPDIVESYRRLGPPVVAAMRRLGVDGRLVLPEEAHRGGRREGPGSSACFASLAPYELVLRGRKLVGNSQLRRRGVVLHHAMTLLDFDPARFASLLRSESTEERGRVAEHLAGLVGSLRWALGEEVSPGKLAEALEAGFAEALGVRLRPGELTPDEREDARRLVGEKYGNREWTYRR